MAARCFASVVLVVLAAFCPAGQAGLLQTLGGPNVPWDVDGHNVVGGGNSGGFVYNDLTKTYTTFIPNSSAARGISGDIVVGAWGINGFMYNLSTAEYTTINDPFGVRTLPTGIDGDNVVGNYVDAAGKQHGFLYDIGTETWTTLDYPGAANTTLTGISGNHIVATYNEGNPFFVYPLMYDLTTSSWTSIPILPRGIDGNNVVGFWQGATPDGAAIYNLVDGTYVNPLIGVDFPPGQIVRSTTFNGIDGNTLVGTYNYRNGSFFANSGFVFNGVPEVGTLARTAVGAVGFAFLLMRRMRDRKSP